MTARKVSVVASSTGLMVVAAIPTFFLAVFAPRIMSRFDVGHTEIGLLVSLIYASAAVLAHRTGNLVDRRGVERGGQTLLLCGVVTMAVLAWSPSFWLLLPASIVAGVALALSNPVTNITIRQALTGRLQRTAMGIKQAGVPLAVVVAGGLLPTVAGWIGWREVALAIGALVLAGLLPWTVVARQLPRRRLSGVPREGTPEVATSEFRLLRYYALAMGCLAGLLNTFYVLYVVNELQWSVVEAGWVAATVGVTGAIARWLWVELAGRTSRLAPVLTTMTIVGCLGTGAMWSSQYLQASTVWVGAVLIGASVMGWQGFVMHAVASKAPREAIGRESGFVMQQFYVGLLLTPFSVGWAIEQFDSYSVLWASQTLLFGLAFVPILLLGRLERRVLSDSPGGPTLHGSASTAVHLD